MNLKDAYHAAKVRDSVLFSSVTDLVGDTAGDSSSSSGAGDGGGDPFHKPISFSTLMLPKQKIENLYLKSLPVPIIIVLCTYFDHHSFFQ